MTHVLQLARFFLFFPHIVIMIMMMVMVMVMAVVNQKQDIYLLAIMSI